VISVIPRDLALKALNNLGSGACYADQYLDRAFRQNPHLSDLDRAFTVNLVHEVLRWRLRLDWIIKQNLKFPFNEIEPLILNILRIALYQIFFMDRVPESAAVNEAVNQTKGEGRGAYLKAFVNGILRHICRQKGQVAFPDRKKDLKTC